MKRTDTYALACVGCGVPGMGPDAVRLDLDTRTDPPEHVCVKCKRKPKCRICGKRRNTLNPEAVCSPCVRAGERANAKRWERICACGAKHDITEMNDHGECPSCSSARLYREHPIAARAS